MSTSWWWSTASFSCSTLVTAMSIEYGEMKRWTLTREKAWNLLLFSWISKVQVCELWAGQMGKIRASEIYFIWCLALKFGCTFFLVFLIFSLIYFFSLESGCRVRCIYSTSFLGIHFAIPSCQFLTPHTRNPSIRVKFDWFIISLFSIL